jgi:hypothetical protein
VPGSARRSAGRGTANLWIVGDPGALNIRP